MSGVCWVVALCTNSSVVSLFQVSSSESEIVSQ